MYVNPYVHSKFTPNESKINLINFLKPLSLERFGIFPIDAETDFGMNQNRRDKMISVQNL